MARSISQRKRSGQMPESVAQGTIYLIGIQLFSRLMTFSANQLLLLYVSPKALGMTMQLELFSITVLYFARESIRMAAQTGPLSTREIKKKPLRSSEQAAESDTPNSNALSPSPQAVVNMSYVASLLGFLILLVFRFLYVRLSLVDVLHAPYFETSLAVVAIATGLELLAEPCFAAVQHNMLYRSRATVETISAFAKGMFSCGTALWMSRQGLDSGALPYAIGQVASSILILCGYFVVARCTARENGFSLLPTSLPQQ